MCFPTKSQKFVIFLGKMQELDAKCKYRQFSANLGQIFAFPTPGIGLMNKDLA